MKTLSLTDMQADVVRAAIEQALESTRQAPSVRRVERSGHRHSGCDLYCVSCDDRFFLHEEADDRREPPPPARDLLVEIALRDVLDALSRPVLRAVGP